MNLQYYKQNVSIIEMVEALGYTYNRNKGRHPKQYEHPNGDKVIINEKLHPTMEVYFTRNNYEDKGTVVDFVKNRLSMFNVQYSSEWEGVMKVLSEFSDQPFELQKSRIQASKKIENKEKPFDNNQFEIKNASLKDLTYLQFDRTLSKETLLAFIPYIHTVRNRDKAFTNIGFPYTIPKQNELSGNERVVGFELVNHGFKGHAKGSQRKQAVWMADLSNAKQLVNNIYIGESAIDVMSFYQLYQYKYDFRNAVLVSTGGNVLKNQAVNILGSFPKAKINTLFDNDFSGQLYDIYLASIKTKNEIGIRKTKDAVLFELKKGTFELPLDQISLARFERVTGIRSGIRAFKAEGKDFNEMLQKRSETKEELNSKNGLKR